MIRQAFNSISRTAIALTAMAGIQASGAFACSSKYAINSLNPPAPATTTFNPSPPRILNSKTKTVPPKYSGLNLFQVYLLLRKRFPEKSEYESTMAHQARLSPSKPFGVIHGYSSDHYLPFVQRVNTFAEKRYNADTHELTVEIGGIAGNPALNTSPRIFIDSKTLNEGSYVGSNIYGGRVVVNRTISCSTSLSLDSFRHPIAKGLAGLGLIIKLPMSPQAAQQARDDLSIIYLAKLAPPFHSYNSGNTRPTIIQPQDLWNDEYIVHGELGGVMVFQASTGRILFNGT